MGMTKRLRGLLFPLLLLGAAFAAAGCDNAGGAPDGPSGPTERYNPEVDVPGATISVTTSSSTVFPRDAFNLMVSFRNGAGQPVEGIPLVGMVEASFGESSGCFGFPINPSVTNEAGVASMRVDVAPDCAAGSYTLVVRTFGGGPSDSATARGTVGIEVDLAVIDVLLVGPGSLVAGTPGVYIASAVTNHPSCNPVGTLVAPGGSVDPAGGGRFVVVFPEGSFLVQATAVCQGKPRPRVASEPIAVTVSAAAAAPPAP